MHAAAGPSSPPFTTYWTFAFKVADLLVRELRKLNAGRVTFMPLNRLKRPGGPPQYPERQDCVPMLRKLKFDEAHRPAVELVFQNALLVKDAAAGSQISRACCSVRARW